MGSVAATVTLGWSYLPRSAVDGIVGTTRADVDVEMFGGDGLEAVERLRSGGLVTYVPPPEPSDAWARSLEAAHEQCVSPLSPQARRGARRMGDALRALDVPIGSVWASESCACLDTARLAFGRATPSDAVTEPASDDTGPAQSSLAEALSTPPQDGANRILVGRRAPLEAVADISLAPGEMAVVAPEGDGFEVVGRFRAETLGRLASNYGTPTNSVASYLIRRGTAEETDVHRIRAGNSGPTVFVVGGIHGSEEAGYRAARRATDWAVDAGTLVVLPNANRPAIERGQRRGRTGKDLNRQFPLGEPPATPLARAVWATVIRHDPDVFIDLHASAGILARDSGYVGQAVFHSGHTGLTRRVEKAVAYLNRAVVPTAKPDYEYLVGRMDGSPEGMVATKAARDRDIPACIYEVTEAGLDLETQVEWTTSFLRQMLALYGLTEGQ